MCNQTIHPPECYAGKPFYCIPFGYTKLEQCHIDKLNGTLEKVLFSNGDRVELRHPPVNLYGPKAMKEFSYFMLTSDFNRFFGICKKKKIPTREELIGTCITEVPYGWKIVEGKVMRKDLYVSGGGFGKKGEVMDAPNWTPQNTTRGSFPSGYIRRIEEESICESVKYYYVLQDKKIVGIVNNPHVAGGPGVSVLEITSNDRISKIEELFKI